MLSMICCAFSPMVPSTLEMKTRPSSSTSMSAPVTSTIFLMTLPPEPMTSRILSGSIWMVMMRGAYLEIVARGSGRHSSILPMMNIRPSLAWARALVRISRSMPGILISIWMAVTPFSVPATLKSMSPRKSSMPWMSVSTVTSSPSLMRPMAQPATGAVMGTPASIRDRVEAQTEPIEVEPLDSMASDTRRRA